MSSALALFRSREGVRLEDAAPNAAKRAQRWLRRSTAGLRGAAGAAPMGRVALIGAGPGVADLLTIRARDFLETADVVVHDALVSDDILRHAGAARRIAVGKRKGCHSAAQDEINGLLVDLARSGLRVVRLKGGDPMVFGRAGEEIAALEAAGIPFEVVPGVTAALAAAASTATPITLRGVSSAVVFATGHDAKGDVPRIWAGLAQAGATLAVYMGRSVAGKLADTLIAGGLSPATPVLAIENAALAQERRFVGRLDALAALAARSDISGPVIMLIGPAVAESHAEAIVFHAERRAVDAGPHHSDATNQPVSA